MAQRLKKINPWDKVFKRVGIVFIKPYKFFPLYLENLKKMEKKGSNIKVLDLGCGTGRHTVSLVKSGFQVYSVDQSRKGIEITKRSLSERKLKANLKVADVFGNKLPYPDNYFDSVLAIAIIYHSTLWNIQKLIKEIARVTKKNGLYFGTSAISVVYSMSINSGTEYIEIEPRSYFPLDGREKHLPHHYFTKQEIKNLFSKDFKKIEILNDKENYYLTICFKK